MNIHTPPPAFNPQYREGLALETSKQYGIWCENHPNATQDERKEAYKTILDNLTPLFPSVEELTK